jgi:hypothetical protein
MTSDRLLVLVPGALGSTGSGIRVMPTSLAAHWTALEGHFERHARSIDRFRETGRAAVLRMWKTQTNETGTPLSPFERDALIERHCELFGTWPDLASSHSPYHRTSHRRSRAAR